MFSSHELDPRHPFDLSIVVSLFQSLSFTVSHDSTEEHSDDFRILPEYFRGLGEELGYPDANNLTTQHALTVYSLFSMETDKDENARDGNGDTKSSHKLDELSDNKCNSVAFAQLPHKTSAKLIPSSVLQPVSKNQHQQRINQSSNDHYSPNQRRAILLQKLVQNFPDESSILLRRDVQLKPVAVSLSDNIHVFVDHSNVCICNKCFSTNTSPH